MTGLICMIIYIPENESMQIETIREDRYTSHAEDDILDIRTKVLKVLNNRKKISLADRLLLPTGHLLQV